MVLEPLGRLVIIGGYLNFEIFKYSSDILWNVQCCSPLSLDGSTSHSGFLGVCEFFLINYLGGAVSAPQNLHGTFSLLLSFGTIWSRPHLGHVRFRLRIAAKTLEKTFAGYQEGQDISQSLEFSRKIPDRLF